MKKPALLLLTLAAVVGALYLRSLASWRPHKVFVDKEWGTSQLLFSRDGKTLVAVQGPYMQQFSGKVHRARVLALDTENNFVPRWASETHLFHKGKAQFFGKDDYLLAGGRSGLIFDVRTGKNGKLPPTPGESVISPDGQWLATSDDRNSGYVSIHPAPTPISGARIADAVKVLGKADQSAEAFAFSPDSKTLAIGVGDSKGTHLELYDTQTWKLIATWNDSTFKSRPGDLPVYDQVQWSPDRQSLLSLFRVNGRTKFTYWWYYDGKKRWSDYFTSDVVTDSISLQDNGHVLYSTGSNLVFDNFAPIANLPHKTVPAFAVSPDGSYLIVATTNGELWKQRLKQRPRF